MQRVASRPSSEPNPAKLMNRNAQCRPRRNLMASIGESMLKTVTGRAHDGPVKEPISCNSGFCE